MTATLKRGQGVFAPDYLVRSKGGHRTFACLYRTGKPAFFPNVTGWAAHIGEHDTDERRCDNPTHWLLCRTLEEAKAQSHTRYYAKPEAQDA